MNVERSLGKLIGDVVLRQAGSDSRGSTPGSAALAVYADRLSQFFSHGASS